MTSFKDIDDLFGRELDTMADGRHYVDQARATLEDAFESGVVGKKRHVKPMLAMAGAASLIAASVLYLMTAPDTLSVSVEGGATGLEVGSWVSSPKNTALHLTFSDGSKIDLMQNTEVRVQDLRDKGAHLLLERGRVAVSVVHRDKTNWQFDAGPYHILVKGTRFQVNWVPETKAFMLDMTNGSVEVDGPMLDGGRSLAAGDNIRVSLFQNVVEINRAHRYERIVARADDAPDASPTPHPVVSSQKPMVTNPPSPDDGTIKSAPQAATNKRIKDVLAAKEKVHELPPEETESWQRLAREGQYEDAVRLAEENGFERVTAKTSLADLMLLGDAARLAPKQMRAVQAYKAVRTRFPGTAEAQRAAFTLGRIAFESDGTYSVAARWFRACFNDDKNGAMAREAAGRLIESLDKAKDVAGAETASEEYLSRFSSGPHTKLAKKILAKRGDS